MVKSLKDILIEQHPSITKRVNEIIEDSFVETDVELADVLIEKAVIDEFDLFKAYAVMFDMPYLENITASEIDAQIVKDLNITFCMQNLIVPIAEDEFSVTLAVNDPFQTACLEYIRLIFNKTMKRVLCPQAIIEETINNLFERVDMHDGGGGLTSETDAEHIEGLDVAHDLLAQDTDEAPVRREVTLIIKRGITERASDIHIEPFEDKVSVRFRIDGRMKEVRVIPKRYQSSVATRIKILAKLNIAESRLPQDGRISLKVGNRDIDMRVSTLPIKYGERIVLRILDKSSGVPPLSKMGLPDEVLTNFQTLIQQKHGIILVTGPTGSGKTTTLAAALMTVNKPDISIITVEDPVEIQMPGVSQVEVNERAGLTFAAALRSILRQNPNVILIGEIRDSETAKIAVQASITGHLVFSTLHTNDTAASIPRLIDFGIEPFQITTAVLGVLAVRLVRRLCPTCRISTKYTKEELSTFDLTLADVKGKTLYKENEEGCAECKNTGYKGRMGVYELLIFDDVIRNFILKNSDGSTLKKLAIQRGMRTLRESAQDRFLNGETSLLEARYATQTEEFDDTNETA